MGLYKLCEHKGRNRDRCEHPWWGSFRGVRVSLSKWANREIRSKAEAGAALDELRMAIARGTFDPQRPDASADEGDDVPRARRDLSRSARHPEAAGDRQGLRRGR